MWKMLVVCCLSGIGMAVGVAAETSVPLPSRGICAHRGNNAHFPENTIPAFRSAVELGVAQVELDIYYSRDLKMVVIHDNTVDRTTQGKGKVSEKTLEELQSLPVVFKGKVVEGVKIPTLEEVLEVCPRNIWLNLHVKGKNIALVRDIVNYLQKEGRLYQSFLLCDRSLAIQAKKECPQLQICNPPVEKTFREYVDSTLALGFQFVQPNPWAYPEMPAEEIDRLHNGGVKINYFGVKNPEHCRQLLEQGVDFPLCDDVTACIHTNNAK